MNERFFWTLFKRSAAKEDTFTECFAETLRQDKKLTNLVLCTILKGNRLGILPPKIIDIQTQVPYPGSIPDIVLVAEDGIKIFIENKMDSPEGKGQLKRYLSLHDLTALAFITRNSRKGMVEQDVIDDRRYLHPAGRDHFLWSDLHDAVLGRSKDEDASLMVSPFLYLLQGLGQRPDRAQTRRWQDDTPEEERLRKWMLQPTFDGLKAKGWRVNFDQKGREIYARDSRWPKMKRLYLNTWSNPGEFQVRLDFSESQELELMVKNASDTSNLPQEHLTMEVLKPGKSEPNRKALDFFIAKENLFGNACDDEVKRKRVKDFVLGVHNLYE